MRKLNTIRSFVLSLSLSLSLSETGRKKKKMKKIRDIFRDIFQVNTVLTLNTETKQDKNAERMRNPLLRDDEYENDA